MFDRQNVPGAATSAPGSRPTLPTNSDPAAAEAIPLLSIAGASARIEGRFDIADSIQIECEVGGELTVGGRLIIGRNGVVRANVRTVDALIMGEYEGQMIATGEVEITETGRLSGSLQTDALVITKGGSFAGDVIKLQAAPPLQFPTPEQRRPSAATFGRYSPKTVTAEELVDASINDSVTIGARPERSEESEAAGTAFQNTDRRAAPSRDAHAREARRHERGHGRSARDSRGNGAPEGEHSPD